MIHNPLNNNINLKKKPSINIPLDNKNTINNLIKYKTFKVVIVYILAIIGYSFIVYNIPILIKF